MICVAVWPIALMLIFVLSSAFATGGIVSGGAGLALKRPRRAVVLSLIVGFTLMLCSGWSGITLYNLLPPYSWGTLFRFVIQVSGIGGLAVLITLIMFRIFGRDSFVEAKQKGDELEKKP